MKYLVMAILFIGCATSQPLREQASASTPLDLRTLEISKTAGSLEYPYRACKKTILGICVGGYDLYRDVYDLNNEAVRNQLIDNHFVCRVEEKP